MLADGGRIHFVRVSPGDTQEDAVLRHDATPTEFNGALLSWNGSLWEMRFPDGSLALFQDCQEETEVCSLIERRDADGHAIAYVRDARGRLLGMESDGQSIAFDYDTRNRIIRAFDTLHHEVTYRYDERDRLLRAASSDGTVREYTYDDNGRLTSVREPGRLLENGYDDAGRWVSQTVKSREDDADPYAATARYVTEDGVIAETAFDDGDGVVVTRYNTSHYIVSETVDAGLAVPVVFAYDRDAVSNVMTGARMTCGAPSPVTRLVPLVAAGDDELKGPLIRAFCAAR